MRDRRWAIIAGLGVAELWIVGMMIRSISGGHDSGYSAAEPKTPVATSSHDAQQRRVSRSVDAGSAPHVIIDDRNATLTISVRTGTTVSVNEQTDVHGWVHGTRRPIVVEQTADGVQIVRGDGPLQVFMGEVDRRLDVVVPPATRLEVKNAGSTTLSGLRAEAAVHSDDGSIAVNDHRGPLSVRTDDGRIELHDVDAPSIDVASDNGRVTLDRVRADRASVTSDDGRIEVLRSLLRSGEIKTSNGRIGLELDPRSDVTVNARAASGKVIAVSPLVAAGAVRGEDAPATIRVGNGSGVLEVGSDDGSITVSAGGVYGS